MARAKVIVCMVSLAVLVLVHPRSGEASDDAFKIIVNRANSLTTVDRDFVARAFLRTAMRWDHGPAIRPVDLPMESKVRARFGVAVLERTPSALRSYWLQRIFSGTATPPPEVSSPAHVVAYVRKHSGAIGYVPAAFDSGDTKIVTIR